MGSKTPGRRKPAEWRLVGKSVSDLKKYLRSEELWPSRPDSEPFIGSTVLTLHGDAHFARRRLEAPLFTAAALLDYKRRILVPAIESHLQKAGTTARGADGIVRVDLRPFLRGILLRIGADLIGLDLPDEDAIFARLYLLNDKVFEGSRLQWSTRDLDEATAELLVYKQAFLEEFIRPAMERRAALVAKVRAGDIKEEDLPRDLLTQLLFAPHPIAEDDIVKECIVFLAASNTATTSAVCITILELEEWLKTHSDDRAQLGDRDFLRKAAMEAIRLHPPTPVILREAHSSLALPSGDAISEGERIGLDVRTVNQDSEVFGADADVFNPYRDSKFHNFGYSFGPGIHVCIGQPLVVGIRAESGDPIDADGIIVLVLQRLFELRLELDPEDPVVRTRGGDFDTSGPFERFPVRLVAL
jgi:cytochrome P450